MARSILVTGGSRSGKSRLAEDFTLNLGQSAIYIATAEAGDAEMAERIARHRARRGPEWVTHAEPLDLTGALLATDGDAPRLVDCVTLWLSNLMHAGKDWESEAGRLVAVLPNLKAPVIFVTNEVGSGIVPENALARRFRDAAGLVNAMIAAACDELWLSVCGQSIRIKPK